VVLGGDRRTGKAGGKIDGKQDRRHGLPPASLSFDAFPVGRRSVTTPGRNLIQTRGSIPITLLGGRRQGPAFERHIGTEKEGCYYVLSRGQFHMFEPSGLCTAAVSVVVPVFLCQGDS